MLVRCSRVAARAGASYCLDRSRGEIPPRLRVDGLGLQSLCSSDPHLGPGYPTTQEAKLVDRALRTLCHR